MNPGASLKVTATQLAALIPLRTSKGGNNREHHFARHQRVKRERFAAGMVLNLAKPIALPCVVLLTRLGPNNVPLDDDNLRHSLKAVRDEVARWLGVNDGGAQVRWVYAQQRQPEWAVKIEAQSDDEQHDEEASGATEAASRGLRSLSGSGLVHDGKPVARQVPALFSADEAAASD